MCEYLTYEDGAMHLCKVCADHHRELTAECERLRKELSRHRMEGGISQKGCGHPVQYAYAGGFRDGDDPPGCTWCDGVAAALADAAEEAGNEN